MYFIWKLHVWVPFKVLSSPTHTLIPRVFPLLETVLVRFFRDGFQLLRRIYLSPRNRLKTSSFESFLLSFGNKKRSRGAWSGEQGGWGRTVIECLAKNARVPNAEWAGAFHKISLQFVAPSGCPIYNPTNKKHSLLKTV